MEKDTLRVIDHLCFGTQAREHLLLEIVELSLLNRIKNIKVKLKLSFIICITAVNFCVNYEFSLSSCRNIY